MVCKRQGKFTARCWPQLLNVGTLPHCRALGLSVLEISVAAGTGADVMAGGTGAAGPTRDEEISDSDKLLVWTTRSKIED